MFSNFYKEVLQQYNITLQSMPGSVDQLLKKVKSNMKMLYIVAFSTIFNIAVSARKNAM